jgi:hypothetical protein
MDEILEPPDVVNLIADCPADHVVFVGLDQVALYDPEDVDILSETLIVAADVASDNLAVKPEPVEVRVGSAYAVPIITPPPVVVMAPGLIELEKVSATADCVSVDQVPATDVEYSATATLISYREEEVMVTVFPPPLGVPITLYHVDIVYP